MSAWFGFYFRIGTFSISWIQPSRSMEQAVRYILTFAIWSERASKVISTYLCRKPFLFFPLFLACSRRSEIFRLRGRPAQRDVMTFWKQISQAFLPLSLFLSFFLLIFSRCSLSLSALHYLNDRNRLIFSSGKCYFILLNCFPILRRFRCNLGRTMSILTRTADS